MKEHRPLVTVLMPVYNSEKYLKEAINSILAQTFKDFEFLIVNDGSTDKSKDIILSYNDKRIVFVENIKNKGLVSSLNRGVHLAKGRYIARMDADDISLPQRLDIQVKYLDNNPEYSLVSGQIKLIDSAGKAFDSGYENKLSVTYSQVKKILPKRNCFAHSTIMVHALLLKEYQYMGSHEDYDLWLRLCDDGYMLSKTNDLVLLYRVHSQSVTQIKSKKNYYKNLAIFRLVYLLGRLKTRNFSIFNFKVFLYLLLDLVLALAYFIKHKTSSLFLRQHD